MPPQAQWETDGGLASLGCPREQDSLSWRVHELAFEDQLRIRLRGRLQLAEANQWAGKDEERGQQADAGADQHRLDYAQRGSEVAAQQGPDRDGAQDRNPDGGVHPALQVGGRHGLAKADLVQVVDLTVDVLEQLRGGQQDEGHAEHRERRREEAQGQKKLGESQRPPEAQLPDPGRGGGRAQDESKVADRQHDPDQPGRQQEQAIGEDQADRGEHEDADVGDAGGGRDGSQDGVLDNYVDALPKLLEKRSPATAPVGSFRPPDRDQQEAGEQVAGAVGDQRARRTQRLDREAREGRAANQGGGLGDGDG